MAQIEVKVKLDLPEPGRLPLHRSISSRQSQHDELLEQSQFGLEPANAPLMMATAQPTPESTEIASSGQFLAHAPHSMQASRSTNRARFSSIRNTAWGQTTAHIPHPVHFVSSSLKVTTFER